MNADTLTLLLGFVIFSLELVFLRCKLLATLYEDVLAPLGASLYHGLNLTFSLIYMFLNYTSKLLKINELYKFSKNYFAT